MFTYSYQNYQPTNVGSQGPLTPWLPAADVNVAAAQSRFRLGQRVRVLYTSGAGAISPEVFPQEFGYVQFASTGLVGEAVAWAAPAADTTTANCTTTMVELNGAYTAQAEVGNLLYVTAFGLRVIKANTTNQFTISQQNWDIQTVANDADEYATAPGNAVIATIIRPFRVQVGSATLVPCGIAVGAYTTGRQGFIQIRGIALASVIGSGTNTTVLGPLVPGATGTLLGTVAANMYTAGVMILATEAYAGAAKLSPILCQF